jgi:hypothetical protein
MDAGGVFSHGLDLPRTEARERVSVKDRDYDLNGSEASRSRPLARFALSTRETSITPLVADWTTLSGCAT